MKWTKNDSNDKYLIETAANDKDRFTVICLKGSRSWSTLVNDEPIDDIKRKRDAAKAVVDPTVVVKQDNRQFNGGRPVVEFGVRKKVTRRTNEARIIGKGIVCERCNKPTSDGGVMDFKTTDQTLYPDRKFSFCIDCIGSFAAWFRSN